MRKLNHLNELTEGMLLTHVHGEQWVGYFGADGKHYCIRGISGQWFNYLQISDPREARQFSVMEEGDPDYDVICARMAQIALGIAP